MQYLSRATKVILDHINVFLLNTRSRYKWTCISFLSVHFGAIDLVVKRYTGAIIMKMQIFNQGRNNKEKGFQEI